MQSIIRLAVTAALAVGGLSLAYAAPDGFQTHNPSVGGAPMYANKTFVENLSNSADHATLVAAIKASGLEDTLRQRGPFTFFAPTDAAFAKLPAGTVDTLFMPENKAMLTSIVSNHIVIGVYDTRKLANLVRAGGGRATLKTVGGGTLTVIVNGMNGLTIIDAKGGQANVTIAGVVQSNGVLHVTDTVLMP
jgi:uncharacterized surface protein with fasciclin (FAS1) repeats